MVSWSPDSIVVERIAGGESHHVFKVTSTDDSKAFVVRVNFISSERQRLKSRREAYVLKLLDGVVASRIYDYDESGRWFPEPVMCIAHVEGTSPDLSEMHSSGIAGLGSLVARVHSTDVDEIDLPGDGYDGTQSLGDYLVANLEWDIHSKIPEDGAAPGLPPGVSEKFWSAYRDVCRTVIDGLNRDVFSSKEDFALMHGDVLGANTIWSGDRPVLVDWEDVRIGDPAEEIAYTFTENRLKPEQRDAFWHGYLSRARGDMDTLKARVAVWQPATAFGSAMWWLDRYRRRLTAEAGGADDGSAPRSLDYYLANALRRLEYQ